MSDDKESGISRAIAIAGNQAALSKLVWEKCHRLIWQARISEYERAGYVPRTNALLISEATGVPLADLLRQGERPRRRVKRKKANA
jgi:hypothetical protein